jgi:hypothetical protein
MSTMSLEDVRSLPHVSVSQLRAFLSCPRRFFRGWGWKSCAYAAVCGT